MFSKLILILTLLSSSLVNGYSYLNPKTIHLNTTNVLTIRGTIDDAVANQFVYDLNKDININSGSRNLVKDNYTGK